MAPKLKPESPPRPNWPDRGTEVCFPPGEQQTKRTVPPGRALRAQPNASPRSKTPNFVAHSQGRAGRICVHDQRKPSAAKNRRGLGEAPPGRSPRTRMRPMRTARGRVRSSAPRAPSRDRSRPRQVTSKINRHHQATASSIDGIFLRRTNRFSIAIDWKNQIGRGRAVWNTFSK